MISSSCELLLGYLKIALFKTLLRKFQIAFSFFHDPHILILYTDIVLQPGQPFLQLAQLLAYVRCFGWIFEHILGDLSSLFHIVHCSANITEFKLVQRL